MQIRTRLTILFTLIATCTLAGVLIVAFVVYRKSSEAEFYHSLETKAELAAKSNFSKLENWKALPQTWIEPESDTVNYSDNLSLYNDNYQRVYTLHPDAVPVPAKALQDAFQYGSVQFKQYNLLAFGKRISLEGKPPSVVIVEGRWNASEAIKIRNILIICFFLGVSLLAISGWYFAGQALAPVSRIMNEVDALYPTNLNQRIRMRRNNDEIGRLTQTFNRMLDRVEYAFRMQRLFLSNVSHELRNPLTAIQTQLDVLLQRERTKEIYEKALQSVLEDVRAISSVEEQLHQLARIYNDPNAIAFEPVRIDEILLQAKSRIQKRRSTPKIVLDLPQMPENDAILFVHGNEELLLTAFVNLLDNACKYAPEGAVILRALFHNNGAHEIFVVDQGKGIPTDEQALIFEPFYRSPRHLQIKGTGIGLPLVQSIFKLHGATLSILKSNETGTIFQILFPVQPSNSNLA